MTQHDAAMVLRMVQKAVIHSRDILHDARKVVSGPGSGILQNALDNIIGNLSDQIESLSPAQGAGERFGSLTNTVAEIPEGHEAPLETTSTHERMGAQIRAAECPSPASPALGAQRQMTCPVCGTYGLHITGGEYHCANADCRVATFLEVRASRDAAYVKQSPAPPPAAQAGDKTADDVAAEAYQVIGSLAHYGGFGDHPEIIRALDYFSSGGPFDGSVLPFGSGLKKMAAPQSHAAGDWEKLVEDAEAIKADMESGQNELDAIGLLDRLSSALAAMAQERDRAVIAYRELWKKPCPMCAAVRSLTPDEVPKTDLEKAFGVVGGLYVKAAAEIAKLRPENRELNRALTKEKEHSQIMLGRAEEAEAARDAALERVQTVIADMQNAISGATEDKARDTMISEWIRMLEGVTP